jgi:hypothetical protein
MMSNWRAAMVGSNANYYHSEQRCWQAPNVNLLRFFVTKPLVREWILGLERHRSGVSSAALAQTLRVGR